jgi:hypothetical protein
MLRDRWFCVLSLRAAIVLVAASSLGLIRRMSMPYSSAEPSTIENVKASA